MGRNEIFKKHKETKKDEQKTKTLNKFCPQHPAAHEFKINFRT